MNNKVMQAVNSLSDRMRDVPEVRKMRISFVKAFLERPYPDIRHGISTRLEIDHPDLERMIPVKEAEVKINNAKGTETLGLIDVMKQYPDMIKYFFSGRDKYELFHSIFWNSASIIRIPENSKIRKPLHIEIDAKGPLINNIIVIAEANSSAQIIQTLKSSGKAYYSELVYVVLKENANIEFASIQGLNPGSYYFSKKNATASNMSTIQWTDCVFGSAVNRISINTELQGRGARANNMTLYFGSQKQKFDIYTSSVHGNEGTHCDMISKGVLDGYSKVICRGNIKIRENAHNSRGYQKSDSLLLSENSEADHIPVLEIDNNEVACTHGVSVSQLNPEKVFYLMSRGLPENIARKSIIEGFFEPMIKKISLQEVRKDLSTLLSKKLSNRDQNEQAE